VAVGVDRNVGFDNADSRHFGCGVGSSGLDFGDLSGANGAGHVDGGSGCQNSAGHVLDVVVDRSGNVAVDVGCGQGAVDGQIGGEAYRVPESTFSPPNATVSPVPTACPMATLGADPSPPEPVTVTPVPPVTPAT